MKTPRSSSLETAQQHFDEKPCPAEQQAARPRGWVGVVAAWVLMGSLTGANAARLPVAAASASADDGNVPANTLDGSLSTRWSAQGDGQWIRFDLGTNQTVGSVKIAWHNGDQRQSLFDVQTSGNGSTWTTVFSGRSSGATTALEGYPTTEGSARY